MERSSGSGLQFKRRHGDVPAAPGVDWGEVDATLRDVDPDGSLADPALTPCDTRCRSWDLSPPRKIWTRQVAARSRASSR